MKTPIQQMPDGTFQPIPVVLSKREQFAMAAMQGLLAKEGMEVSLHTEEGVLIVPASKGIPMLAVRYADRLLAELEKSE